MAQFNCHLYLLLCVETQIIAIMDHLRCISKMILTTKVAKLTMAPLFQQKEYVLKML